MGNVPRRILPLAVFSIALQFAAPVPADVEAGKRAYQAGDYATALSELRWDASQGNPAALMGIGQMYEKGQGVATDPYTAFVLYRVALAQGNKQAEPAANRVANLLPGQDLARGVQEANRLAAQRKYLPPLPGVAAAAPAPKPPAPSAPAPAVAAPKPVVAAAAPPGPAPAAAPMPVAPANTAGARIEYRYTCNMLLRWQDEGSGGRRDLALFQPESEPGYYTIGGHAQTSYNQADDCSLTLHADDGNLLVAPAGWDRVWKDKGAGALMDGSIWRARSPDAEHVCLGDVAQAGKDQPTVPQYRCVHRCLVTGLKPTAPLWTTENTGADTPLAVYRLPHAKSFVAVPKHPVPAEILDLNPNPTCR
jgi:hypothetical protein